jgi:hypothetical protein
MSNAIIGMLSEIRGFAIIDAQNGKCLYIHNSFLDYRFKD